MFQVIVTAKGQNGGWHKGTLSRSFDYEQSPPATELARLRKEIQKEYETIYRSNTNALVDFTVRRKKQDEGESGVAT